MAEIIDLGLYNIFNPSALETALLKIPNMVSVASYSYGKHLRYNNHSIRILIYQPASNVYCNFGLLTSKASGVYSSAIKSESWNTNSRYYYNISCIIMPNQSIFIKIQNTQKSDIDPICILLWKEKEQYYGSFIRKNDSTLFIDICQDYGADYSDSVLFLPVNGINIQNQNLKNKSLILPAFFNVNKNVFPLYSSRLKQCSSNYVKNEQIGNLLNINGKDYIKLYGNYIFLAD